MLRPVMPTRTRLNRAISVALGLLASTPASANPEGMQVIQGAVGVGMPNPQTLEITNSPGAIINWQGFDIGAGEITRFIQQGADSAVLNRVTTQNSSEIFGQLLSNGRVFLINPAGILVGRDAVVDTAGLVMSTLDIKDADFTAGRFRFEGGPGSGAITNHGYIKAAPNGEIILIAPRIVNAPEAGNVQSGLIEAENGELILAAGHAITISSLDDPDISFDVQAPEHEVVNLGQLIARGGSVSAFAGTLRHSGEINADALSIDDTGRVVLTASHRVETSAESVISARGERAVEESAGTVATEAPESTLPNPVGATGGDIRITATAPAAEEGATPVASSVALAGTIDARGRTGGSVRVEADATTVGGTLDASGLDGGGRVEVLGADVALAAANVRANALDGDGGQVRVGGDYKGGSALRAATTTEVDAASRLEANAGGAGDGGIVVVWSNEETRFKGTATARGGDTGGDGGLVEVSGKDILRFGGSVDVGAPAGDAGTLLLDPKNIFIVQGGATVGIDNPTPFAGDGFGSSFTVLANGNILVQNQNADSAGATDAGEVVLMDGFGNVLGSITGSATNQRLGAFSFFNAAGGLLILDRNAPNGAALQAGAVHLFDDDTGQVIGTTLGGSAGELFGSSLIGTFGSNFMFRSTSADIAGIGADVGLVSLISGTTGLEIGRTIGQSAGELFGSSVTNLGTSLLVRSTTADVGALTDAGSVSFVSTTTGTLLGKVDGQSANEFFGSSFSNLGGTIQVRSADADVGGLVDAGSVVLISSTTGAELGRVQGAAAGDRFGLTVDLFGVPTGTFLIRSNTADVGGFTDNGTAVLVSRTTGLEIGRTSGLRDGDGLGGFFPILDGANYFLQVPDADIGANTDAGSMVLVNGTTGTRIGSADGTSPSEFFSQNGIELFGPANNIIVISELADTGGGANAGSVVSVDRTTGAITGRVDGTSANEQLGSFGLVSRSNGNYLIPSPLFDTGGGIVDVGSVILADGNTGNLLGRFDGDTAGERFGEDRLDFSLANDDILVMAPAHTSGAGIIAQLASVETTPGVILRGAFQGAATGDAIGSIFPTFLSTGNYVIADPGFNAGDGVVVIIDDVTGAPVSGATVGTTAEGLGGDMDFFSLPTFGHFAALSPGHGANSEGAIYFFDGNDGGGLIRQFIGNTSETLGTEDLIIAPSGNVIVGSPFNTSGAGSIYLLDGIGATYATIDQLDGLSAGESLGDSGVTTIDVFSRSAFNEFLVFSPLRDGAGTDSGGIILAKTVGPSPILLGVINGAGAGDRLGEDPFSQMLSNGNTVFFNPTADDPSGPPGTADDEGAIVLMDSVGAFLGRFFGQSPGENLGDEFVVFESFRVGANSMFVQSPDASPGAVSNAGSLYLLSTADASLIGQADGDTVNENFSDDFDLFTLGNGDGLVLSPDGFGGGGTIVQVADADLGGGIIIRGRLNGTVGGGLAEQLGDFGVQVLGGGTHYMARSPFADPGALVDAGSMYFVNIATGALTNRIDGISANEEFGNFGTTDFFSHGTNFFVTSEEADVGAATDAGRVMLVDTTGFVIDELLGNTANEFLGQSRTFVGSDIWVLAPKHSTDAGAIFAIANSDLGGGNMVRASLQGGTAGDQLGSLFPNFVSGGRAFVRVPLADVGGIVDAGTAILVNSSLQELGRTSGTSAEEEFSSFFFTTLANGNFLFRSPDADIGGLTDSGVVKVVSGTTGTLVGQTAGTSADERFGAGSVVTLINDDIAIFSPDADSGGFVDAGAIVQVSPDTGLEVQRVVGLSADERLGSSGFQFLPGGKLVLGVPLADVAGVVDAGRIVIFDPVGANTGTAATNLLFTNTPGGDFVVTTGAIELALNAGANLILQANNDIVIGKDVVLTGGGGSLTLQAGRSILVSGLINMPSTDIKLLANDTAGDTSFRTTGSGDFVLEDPQIIGRTVEISGETVRLLGGFSETSVYTPTTTTEFFDNFLLTGSIDVPATFVLGLESLKVFSDSVELIGGSSPGAFAALVSFGEFTVDTGTILLEAGSAPGAHALFLGLGGLGDFTFDTCTGCGDTLLFTDPFLENGPVTGLFIAGIFQDPAGNAILAMLGRDGDSNDDDDDDDDEEESQECGL